MSESRSAHEHGMFFKAIVGLGAVAVIASVVLRLTFGFSSPLALAAGVLYVIATERAYWIMFHGARSVPLSDGSADRSAHGVSSIEPASSPSHTSSSLPISPDAARSSLGARTPSSARHDIRPPQAVPQTTEEQIEPRGGLETAHSQHAMVGTSNRESPDSSHVDSHPASPFSVEGKETVGTSDVPVSAQGTASTQALHAATRGAAFFFALLKIPLLFSILWFLNRLGSVYLWSWLTGFFVFLPAALFIRLPEEEEG